MNGKTKKQKESYNLIIALVIFSICILDFVVLNDAYNKQEVENAQIKIEKKGELIFGCDGNAAPLSFNDEDSQLKGVLIDYMDLISLELGVDIKMESGSQGEVYNGLKKGQIDIADMFDTQEREGDYAFSGEMFSIREVIAVKTDSDNDLNVLTDGHIACVKGDYVVDFMKRYYPNAKLEQVSDLENAMSLLHEGKVDAVVGAEPVILNIIAESGLKGAVKTLDEPLTEQQLRLAVSKSEEDILPAINQAIKSINKKNQVETIQEKWLALSSAQLIDENEKVVIRIVVVLGILAAITIFVYLWNLVLRRRVNLKTEELQSNQKELKLILSQMPVDILLVTEDGRVINGNMTDKVGMYKCNSFMMNICNVPICTGNPSTCNNKCILHECFETGNRVERKIEAESATYQVQAIPTPVAGNETDKSGALVTMQDITKEEINDRQLLQSSKMMAIGQLAAGMAHQMKNPLGVIRTQSYLVRNRKDDSSIEKSLDYIDHSVERMKGTIDNVMSFWRAGGEENEVLNVKETVELVLDLNDSAINKYGINVYKRIDDVNFVTNLEALNHILHNLVSNATDAMERGGTLTVKAIVKGEWLNIDIEDTGCGIKEEDIPSLFNPFFTTKAPGKGTGLGMFIVYSECEKIGGTISVESLVDVGTCFHVRIPEGKVTEDEQ